MTRGLSRQRRRLRVAAAVAALAVVAACGAAPGDTPSSTPASPTVAVPSVPSSAPSVASSLPSASPAPSTVATPSTVAAPAWEVGSRVLPLRSDGFGQVLPTPAVLDDRRLPTADVLPPPSSGGWESTVSPVPADVLARSTWQAACPVSSGRLRYLTMSFHGFDARVHTGEMLVRDDVADDVVAVFRQLFAAGFPLEEMRVTGAWELDLPPTGDGDNTSAFVCRPARGQTRWSAHAYGLAVDVNPFQNPYSRGDLVLPELASSYLDRARVRDGMILRGDEVVQAFDAIGWTWGGTWRTPVDRQHFSATGD